MRRKLAPFKAPKYTIKDFAGQFADDAACLARIFKTRFPDGLTCPKCGEVDRFAGAYVPLPLGATGWHTFVSTEKKRAGSG